MIYYELFFIYCLLYYIKQHSQLPDYYYNHKLGVIKRLITIG